MFVDLEQRGNGSRLVRFEDSRIGDSRSVIRD